MEKSPELKNPLHLLHCMAQLCVMYATEVQTSIQNAFEDSLDCWGSNDD